MKVVSHSNCYWMILLAFIWELLGPNCLKAQSSRRGRTISSLPPSSAHSKPLNRVGLQLICNYVGSGIGLVYERVFTSYFNVFGELAFTQAKLSGELAPNVTEEFSMDTGRLGLGAKLVFKGRIFLAGGVNFASINGDYGYQDNNENLEATFIPFTGQNINAELHVGNEFLLKYNLYVALKWVGFSFPLSTSIEDEATTADDEVTQFLASQSVGERVKAEFEEQIKLHYFTVNLGLRF